MILTVHLVARRVERERSEERGGRYCVQRERAVQEKRAGEPVRVQQVAHENGDAELAEATACRRKPVGEGTPLVEILTNYDERRTEQAAEPNTCRGESAMNLTVYFKYSILRESNNLKFSLGHPKTGLYFPASHEIGSPNCFL